MLDEVAGSSDRQKAHREWRAGLRQFYPAQRYMDSFQRACAERPHFASPGFRVKARDQSVFELPPLKLDHLRRMTDDTGILQHAFYTVPSYRDGYTTDDNARALIVSVLLEELGNSEAIELAYR